MAELRVQNITISLDWFAAGPDQSVDDPLGVGGTRLHEWMFATRTGSAMVGMDGGKEGIDDEFVARGDVGIGADGIEAARERAFDAADGADVRIGGGASTIQQYLRAGLVDELHIAIAPVLLGGGERLFDDLGDGLDDYEIVEFVGSPAVTHARLARKAASP